MSLLTYVAAAIGLAGGVPEHLPFVPNLEAQMASSFVNRVTPANVGGMALNVRFLQKAGVDAGEAVTGVGLNVAGRRRSSTSCCSSCSSPGRARATARLQDPGGSKMLVIIAVVLAVIGHRHRDAPGAPPLPHARAAASCKQSWTSIVVLAALAREARRARSAARWA